MNAVLELEERAPYRRRPACVTALSPLRGARFRVLIRLITDEDESTTSSAAADQSAKI